MIDGDCLATFVAIAEERSFSRAADRLGVAQSVISKRLRRLEDQLATQLVDRSTRTDIRLTRIGRIFLPEAMETLAQLHKAERTGRNLARGCSGPLRIGYVFSAAMNGTLTTVLGGLREALPDMEFQPRLMETPEQLAALDAGMLDMGLLRPRPSYPPGCQAREVHQESLVLGLSSRHRLAGQSSLTPPMLASERFIVPQFHEQVGLIDCLRRLAAAGRFAMPSVIQTADFVTAACLAATGDGIVLAPASLANFNLSGLAFQQVAGFNEFLTIALVMRMDAPEEARRTANGFFPYLPPVDAPGGSFNPFSRT